MRLCDRLCGVASPPSCVVDFATRCVVVVQLVANAAFVTKCTQLYDACVSRHGVMVVGPAAVGKSSVIAVTASALSDTLQRPVRVVAMNPKAVTVPDMFGYADRSPLHTRTRTHLHLCVLAGSCDCVPSCMSVCACVFVLSCVCVFVTVCTCACVCLRALNVCSHDAQTERRVDEGRVLVAVGEGEQAPCIRFHLARV